MLTKFRRKPRGRTCPALAPGEPDPSTPANRLALSRRLLADAIRRYEGSLAFLFEVRAANPNLVDPAGRRTYTDLERAERFAWRILIDQADADFDSAEEALAVRIHALHDFLAPESMRVGPDVTGDVFRERAVRSGGTAYILNYNPGEYEPGTNIVTILRDGRAFDLDAPEVPIDHES